MLAIQFKEWGADDGKHYMAWRMLVKKVKILIKICGQ